MKEKKKLAGCSCAEQHVFLDPAAVDLESAQGLEGGQGGLARGVKLDVLRGLDVVIGEEDAVARLLLLVAVHLCAQPLRSANTPRRDRWSNAMTMKKSTWCLVLVAVPILVVGKERMRYFSCTTLMISSMAALTFCTVIRPRM